MHNSDHAHEMMTTHDHSDQSDHSGHGDHSEGSAGHGGHMMSMSVSITPFYLIPFDNFHFNVAQFHFGYTEVILFDQWSIDSVGGLIASVLVIALAAALYEALKYYREYLFWKTYNSLQYRAVTLPEKTAVVGTSSEDNARVQ